MKECPFQAHLARRRLAFLTIEAWSKVIFFCATMLLSLASLSRGQNANFTITDFSKDMSLSGSCLVDDGTGILLMTAIRNRTSQSAAVNNACKAVYARKVRFYDPPTGLATTWNTSFTFTIQPQEGAVVGEFMAFAITANATVGTPLAAGLYDDTVFSLGGNPKIQVVAVRFFTYWNNVSLLINDKEDTTGRYTWNLDKYNVFLNKSPEKMKTYQAWIDYDATSKLMDFYIASQDGLASKSVWSRVFCEYLDLSNATRYAILRADSYVGFTAATTADHREIHQIIRWQFSHQASNSAATRPSSTRASSKSRKGLIVGAGVGAALLVLGLSIVGMAIMRRYIMRPTSTNHLDAVNFGPRRLRYAELRVATNNFSDEKLLGKGGFGSVYKGSLLLGSGNNNNLEEEVVVAIKRISQNSTQGEREFEAEVLSIGRLRHRNLVPLLGWCHEQDELLLVYEFMANGSLDRHLYGSNHAPLSWESRFQILKSVAAALDYLHNGWEQCIVHRDIKPSNVMLDAQMNARLGDFGLARLVVHRQGNHDTTTAMSHFTNVVGTIGYIAPASNCYQAFTPKSDVYSFGIMALEVVCRRLPHNPVEDEDNLVTWVWSMHKQGQLVGVIDAALRAGTDLHEPVQLREVMRVLELGMLCTMLDPSLRLRTEKLLPALKGDWSVSLPASRTGSLPPTIPSTSPVSNSSGSGPLVASDYCNRSGSSPLARPTCNASNSAHSGVLSNESKVERPKIVHLSN